MTFKATETFLYQPVVPDADAIRVAWLYPYTYGVSMSSLGYLSLFKQLDTRSDVAVRRINTDSLAQETLRDDELVGVSFSFELDIVELLKAFEQLDMPFLAQDRTDSMPLVFAGGPVVMTNPEPYADFFDFFLIGEGEEALDNLMTVYKTVRSLSRQEQLKQLALHVPGLYVPSLYDVTYEPKGPIQSISPKLEGLPFPVKKQFVSDMSSTIASSPILSPDAIFSNTYMLEVMRGCAHRCRFCLASYSMLPARGPSFDLIKDRIEEGLRYTHKIGLVGALIAEHPDFEQICDLLRSKDQIEIGSASLRADTLTESIAETFKHGGQKTVTIAVETGSESLRKRINKHLKTEDIYKAAEIVHKVGIQNLKLYMMVGLPDETDADVQASVDLVKGLKAQFPTLSIQFGCSTHVPKAATPFQWVGREDTNILAKKHWTLQKQVSQYAKFRPTSAKWDTLQALLSRGDRRLGPWLVAFVEQGGNLGAMNRASKAVSKRRDIEPIPDLAWYAERERPFNETLPWDTLSLGVDKHILYRESGLKPADGLETELLPALTVS